MTSLTFTDDRGEQTLKVGDRVERFRDTTESNENYFFGRPGTIKSFGKNTQDRDIVYVILDNFDSSDERGQVFYPNELRFVGKEVKEKQTTL